MPLHALLLPALPPEPAYLERLAAAPGVEVLVIARVVIGVAIGSSVAKATAFTFLGVWAISRTWGLPVGDHAGDPVAIDHQALGRVLFGVRQLCDVGPQTREPNTNA